VFGLLARQGDVPQPEMERVFNMGVGMAAVVAPADADEAQRLLVARGIQAWPLGEVTEREDVRLTGSHPPDG
jgi:phosphoribosylformylglycinamidine cyclo-ligase